MEKSVGRNCFWKTVLVILLTVAWLVMAKTPLALAESVEEGAKREGKVLFYSGMTNEDNRILMDGFQNKYPFLKGECYRATETAIFQKIVTERRMGQHLVDVIHMAGFVVNLYKKEGLVQSYVSPEAKGLPQGFKDPEGFWTSHYTTYHNFIYNTKMVAKKELPKTYEDLLNPRWKRKIGMHTEELEWYMGMMDFLGEERGRQFMRRLAEQDLMMRNGRTLIANLMVAGEFPMALGVVHRTLQQQKEGAPVEMIPFSGQTLAAMRCLGFYAKSPHPNAAKLLVDFILSKEGQSIFNRISRHPVRMDVQVHPVVDKIRQNLFLLRPRDPEFVQSSRKEFDKIFKKR